MNISSFKMLSRMWADSDKCWIRIRSVRRSRTRERRFISDMKIWTDDQTDEIITFSHKIKIMSRETCNRAHDEIKSLERIIVSEKTIFLPRNILTARKIIFVLIVTIQIIQDQTALIYSIWIEHLWKRMIRSNLNLSKHVSTNVQELKLFKLAALVILKIIMFTSLTTQVILNSSLKDSANRQKTSQAFSWRRFRAEVYLSN